MNSILKCCLLTIRSYALSALVAGLLAIGAPASAQQSTPPPAAELPASDPPAAVDEDDTESPQEEATSSRQRQEIMRVGSDSTLDAGATADTLIAIGGSAISEGDVSDTVVAISGDARVGGSVGDEVVAVFGNAIVNGNVGGDVVAVFGRVELGPNAKIDGDVVAVGGRLIRDPAAIVVGSVKEVSLPGALGELGWLRAWVRHGLLYGRPLALEPSLSWAWFLSLGLLGFYVLLTILFPRASERCVGTLTTQPGYSLLAALLTVLLIPFLLSLLVISVIGVAAVPVLAIAFLSVGLFGKATALAAIGHRLLARAPSPFNHVAVAALLGGLIVLALYVVPVAGFIVQTLAGLLGFGAVIYTLALSLREKHRNPRVASVGAPIISSEDPSMYTETATQAEPSSASMSAASATTLPRASFGLRMAALLVDVLLIAVVVANVTGLFLLPLAIYGAIMWRLKGTTIGGIVFGLQVVRVDGQPIDWATAIVRALSCFLSIFALGLGFLWILFDSERQAWHDKIAGTVVCVRKGLSLT